MLFLLGFWVELGSLRVVSDDPCKHCSRVEHDHAEALERMRLSLDGVGASHLGSPWEA